MLQAFNEGRNMHRMCHLAQLVYTLFNTPQRKSACRPCVSLAGIRVSDLRGKELNHPFSRVCIRSKESR